MGCLTTICNAFDIVNIEKHIKPANPYTQRIIHNFKIITESLTKADKKLLLKNYNQKVKVLS